MKHKQKKVKKIWPVLLSLPLIPISLVSINSCSSNGKTSINQSFVDQEYDKFYNSVLINSLNNNLYFENFDFQNKNEIVINKDQMEKYLTINDISNFFTCNFVLKKLIPTNEIEIKMILKDENGNNFNPSDSKKSIKILKNIKSLSQEQNELINDLSSSWTNSKNITIKNYKNEILKQQDYSKILASYLTINNFNLSDVFSKDQKDKIQNNKWFINYDFSYENSIGKVNLKFYLINQDTNLKIYFLNNNNIDIEGFAKQSERDKEVIEIFKQLGSNSYNLPTIIKKGKTLPYLPSSIYNIEMVGKLLNAINDNLETTATNIRFVLPDYFNKSTNHTNLWYELETSINANDSTGIVTISFVLVDKFTQTKIIPENIVKSMTISGMLKLSEDIKDTNKYDNSSIENGYKAYNLMNKIEINNGYGNLPSVAVNNIPDTINIGWLIQNTNIKKIIPNINDQSGEFVLSSKIYQNNDPTLIGKEKTNTFRIVDFKKTSYTTENVNGLIKIPIILEIKLNIDGQEQWIQFMPPKTKNGEGIYAEYSSATNECFIQIGGYRTQDIDKGAIIYNYFENNNELLLEINNKYYYNELIKKIKYQNQVIELLKTEINEKFEEIIKTQLTNNNEYLDFLKKFSYYFDLEGTPIKAQQGQNKDIEWIETDLVDFKVVSKENEKFVLNYYPNNSSTTKSFPKVKIKIKFKP